MKKRPIWMAPFLIVHWSLLFGGEVSDQTRALNAYVQTQLPFDERRDFEDFKKGFVVPLANEGVIKNTQGEIVWDLKNYAFVTQSESAPNSVNPSLWRQLKLLTEAGLFKVTEGIYQVRGADLSNMTIVEGKTGLIVIDTLLSKETAKAALDLYYQNRPKRPICAVIYTHSHADHFGGVKGIVSQEEVDQGKVKIIAPAGFTQAAIEENVMVGNAMGRRAIYMYGVHLVPGPMGQVSTGLGLATSTGEVTLILPTDLVTQTGQEMMIDGVRFVFLMAPDSEAPAEMLFFLPDFKALCAAEDATHTMHNIYTLRGAKIRDAKAWAMYLNQAIEMFGANTEVVFAQHHWPMWGQERIGDYLEKQRDMYKYIHDQTVRLANEGYTMLEIGEKIVLPESLAKQWYNRGYYGSLNHNVKSVYNFYLGWFSGNPSALHPLPEVEASKKYVEYMGGEEAILKRARQDYSKGQYRWVAEVLNHLVFANPNHKIARDLLADTLEQMGYQAENATWRNFFLTGAKELRSNDKVSATLRPGSRDVVAVMPTEDFLDYLAVHLNGPKAAQHPMNLHFNLNDKNERYLLQIKNGVLNYFPAKTSDQVDFTLSLNRSDFNALMTHAKTAKDLIRDKQLSIEGDQKVLEIFLTLFDHFDPSFNIILPRQDEGVYQKN